MLTQADWTARPPAPPIDRPLGRRPVPAPPRAGAATRDASPPVVTILTPDERLRVDAAGEGCYHTMHRDSLDDVRRDLRARRAAAVLVSVARCGAPDAARVASLVREFPRVPAVALLSELTPASPQAMLSLGRSGVRTLVDARQPAGWRELRSVLATGRANDLAALALERLAPEIGAAPEDCRRFFETLFACAPRVTTVRALSQALGVVPSTLMSRFFRARLPAPKRYLAFARLTRAARLFENPGLSVASVANHLEYSSPQSFGRHVKTLLHVTAVEFRHRYDGDGMLERFRADLVTPHGAILRTFTPLTERPGWLGK